MSYEVSADDDTLSKATLKYLKKMKMDYDKVAIYIDKHSYLPTKIEREMKSSPFPERGISMAYNNLEFCQTSNSVNKDELIQKGEAALQAGLDKKE